MKTCLLTCLSVAALAVFADAALAFDSAAILFAQVPRGSGQYLHLGKLIAVCLMFIAWTATCHWVNDDAHGLQQNAVAWNSAVVFAGLIGIGCLFALDSFIVAVLLFAIFYLSPTLGYVYGVRNPSVPDHSKVLTPDHIQYLMTRLLAKVGIKLPSGDEGDGGDGPPLIFVAKTSHGRVEDKARIRNAEGSRGYSGARELVYDAIIRRSTDIHLEPTPEEMVVRYRIDGVLVNSDPFDRKTGDAIINVFKVLSAMDITEKRKPQDGSFGAELGDRKLDFRVACSGSATGEKMVIRILDSTAGLIQLLKLGMTKKMIEKVQQIALQPYGLMLCSGPTGAGKSTTLYACLQEIDKLSKNIITIEDPVEYHIDGITQMEVNTKAGQTFATYMRSVLRQDPDVILVGEIRDKETAETACQAAQTGHMVFSTVHANDSITSVFRLLDLGVDPGNLATSLSAILAQRLVRVLCKDCKEGYKPSREVLEKANMQDKEIDVLYRPGKLPNGECPTCGGTGYFGRTGVYELLTVTEKMRDLIRDRAALRDFKQEARRGGTEYLQEYALKLVAHGRTSFQEVSRVVK